MKPITKILLVQFIALVLLCGIGIAFISFMSQESSKCAINPLEYFINGISEKNDAIVVCDCSVVSKNNYRIIANYHVSYPDSDLLLNESLLE